MNQGFPTPVAGVAIVMMAVALGAVGPCSGQVCGNGVVEGTEECDDGAAFRLDGCAPDCRYEHVQRMTQLELAAGVAPGICTPATNAFGSVFTSLGLIGVNAQLSAAIGDGSLDQLLQILELDDPSAVDDPDLEVGAVVGDVDPRGPGTGFDGWYLADADSIGAGGLPAVLVSGSVTARELAAGPTTVEIAFLGGSITFRDAFITALVGTPTSEPSPPPDQLAAGFAAFEELQANDGSHGLCGNLTVGSLAVLPLPADFAAGGAAECSASCSGSRGYTWCGAGNPVGPGCNSLLDVLVSGCAVSPPLCLAVIVPTQPDVGTGGQPPAALVADPTTGKVSVVEPDDAYSSWLEFTSERVHLTTNVGGLFTDGFESASLTAWSSAAP